MKSILVAMRFGANRLLAKELLLPGGLGCFDAAILSLLCPYDVFSLLDNLVSEITWILKQPQKTHWCRSCMSKASTTRPSTTSTQHNHTTSIRITSRCNSRTPKSIRELYCNCNASRKFFWDRKEYTKEQNHLLLHSNYYIDNNKWNLTWVISHKLNRMTSVNALSCIKVCHETKCLVWTSFQGASHYSCQLVCVLYHERTKANHQSVSWKVLQRRRGSTTTMWNKHIAHFYVKRPSTNSEFCKRLDPSKIKLCPDSCLYTKFHFSRLCWKSIKVNVCDGSGHVLRYDALSDWCQRSQQKCTLLLKGKSQNLKMELDFVKFMRLEQYHWKHSSWSTTFWSHQHE